jgi:hypothetical protein
MEEDGERDETTEREVAARREGRGGERARRRG